MPQIKLKNCRTISTVAHLRGKLCATQEEVKFLRSFVMILVGESDGPQEVVH
jgi:hypothetical protein